MFIHKRLICSVRSFEALFLDNEADDNANNNSNGAHQSTIDGFIRNKSLDNATSDCYAHRQWHCDKDFRFHFSPLTVEAGQNSPPFLIDIDFPMKTTFVTYANHAIALIFLDYSKPCAMACSAA
jgi:hypothetical protein